MYHFKTDNGVKESICSSYQTPNGNILVVPYSTSFRMGLIVKGVDTVVRYGPAYDIDDHLQKTGRDPLVQSHAILLLYKRSLGSRNTTTPMEEICPNHSVSNIMLVGNVENTPKPTSPLHNCCYNCRKKFACSCKCSDE